jgi:hypothetical protein
MRLAVTSLVVAFTGLVAAGATAAERTAAELLPASTVLYAELSQPKALLATVLDHPLVKKVEALDAYRQATADPKYVQFRAIVTLVEGQLGQGWRQALESITAGGIHLGFDGKTQSAALLVRAENAEALAKTYGTLARLAEDDARRKGNPAPWQTTTYRDITVYRNDKAAWGLLGPWLVLVNKPELGKQIVDRYFDGGGDTLASAAIYRQVKDRMAGKTAWAMVDLAAVRSAGLAKELFRGKAENPVAELLLGGALADLAKAPWAAAALDVKPDHVLATLAVAHDPAWIGPEREYYFGPQGTGRAPPLASLPETLFSLSTYRDLGAMWQRAGDLYDEKTQDQLAQAESGLSTFFSGKDFGEEVLGATRPEVQLVAVRQSLAEATRQPAVKLPAFALIFRMKEPEKVQPEFRRTFQSLIGFLNVVGAMNGQPQLDQETATVGAAQIVATRYVADKTLPPDQPGKVQENFSPTLAFAGERMIVSSTRKLAESLATATQDDAHISSENSLARLDGRVLRDVLADNREPLIAQNMLENGHTREKAEQEVNGLLAILAVFQDATLSLKAADQALELNVAVRLAQ